MSELKIKSLAVVMAAFLGIFVTWFALEVVGEPNKLIAQILGFAYLIVGYFKSKSTLIKKYGVKNAS